MPLSDLVGDPADMLRAWPAAPSLHPHPAGTFDHLITLDEIDRLIDSNCLPCRTVRLIGRNGKIIDESTYTRDGDMPAPGSLRQHLDDGGSLSLRLMETTFPALAALYQELRAETGYTGHISGYLTPPGEQGFRFHYDPYTSIIAQLAGGKEWPLHRPVVDFPVEEYGDFRVRGFTDLERHHQATTAPFETYTLHPGDVLWVPQGWVHSPHNRNGDVPSFHLTIALKPRNLHWAVGQLAPLIAQRVLSHPDGRQPLTPAALLDDSPTTAKAVRSCVLGVLAAMDDEDLGTFLRRSALPDSPSAAPLLR
ncbi:JmjC domain-containing protein [Streptomyces sp. NPDC021080]|uniref:JmjC domain-containing protein n=1 Tax=Streptomyces sp. NPDC021080 TaxID=3365110 RepID=UPI0037AF7793